VNGSTSVTVALNGTGSANITLTLNGTIPVINQPFNFGNCSTTFDVLSSQSFTLKDIPLTASDAKLVLRIYSSILGSIVVSGPGTVSPTTLSWSNWGQQSTTVTATSSAAVENYVTLTTSLNYTINAVLEANVTGVGAGTYTISSINIPAITGSPSIRFPVMVVRGSPSIRFPVMVVRGSPSIRFPAMVVLGSILFGPTIIPGIPNILLIAIAVVVIMAAIAIVPTRRKR
jgi:hypothetical protein